MVKEENFQMCLSDIMIFTTGVPTEPPLGFRHKPCINLLTSWSSAASVIVEYVHARLTPASSNLR